MPCDTIQRSSVNLELKVDNKAFLKAALESMHASIRYENSAAATTGDSQKIAGFYVSGVTGTFLPNGTLKLDGRTSDVQRFDLNKLKRAYSREVVRASSKRFGWTLTEESETTFEVQKKGF